LNNTEKEIARYTYHYYTAIQQMWIEVATVVKTHPNAIIIFMSDHGGFLIDDGYRIPPNYDYSTSKSIKFRDLFGAFMAVRWPNKEKAAKYDSNFVVTQDLFPIVFAYLFDSPVPLEYKQKNTAVRLGPHLFDKGVFYPDSLEGK
jgi:arylsulfatase A-like enzyme